MLVVLLTWFPTTKYCSILSDVQNAAARSPQILSPADRTLLLSPTGELVPRHQRIPERRPGSIGWGLAKAGQKVPVLLNQGGDF